MRSAFGVDHGELSKSLADKAARGYLQTKAGVQGFKLGRTHHKLARAERGLSNSFGGGFKQGFKAGAGGPITRSTNALKTKTARSVARSRTADDIDSITRTSMANLRKR